MIQWEYRLVRIDYVAGDLQPQLSGIYDVPEELKRKSSLDLEVYLNYLGTKGWELVTMNYTPGYGYGFLILKRPKD